MKSTIGPVSALSLASSLALALPLIAGPAVTAFADDINPGVFAIDSQPYGQTYGQWSAQWWQWAVSVPNQPSAFDGCPNESGPVWFLSGVSPQNSGNCVVPAGKAIMFPTFNAEWSVAEANMNGEACVVPVPPSSNGTSYAALLTCARAISDFATQPGATLEADVDARKLQSLLGYRAHSDPPPFPFRAISGNIFVPVGKSSAVADGFWIMLGPLSPGSHTIHFAASVPIPPLGFNFNDDATFNLVVR